MIEETAAVLAVDRRHICLHMEAFRRKGRMSKLMEAIPVHVIMNMEAVLLGAAFFGLPPEGQ